MRVFNKSEKKVTVKWDAVEYEFKPQTVVHVRNYEVGKALTTRNPNIVDYDEWMADRDKLITEGKIEEANAMKLPLKEGFELPLPEEPQGVWLDKAISLGMRNVGRGTPKESLIEFCTAAVGLPPGPPVPEQVLAQDRERIDVLKGSSAQARQALEAAGVEGTR